MNTIEQAIESMRNGKPVLIYDADGREEETDMTIASEKITPQTINLMRKDCGGLICTTITNSIATKLGLPYLVDAFNTCDIELFKRLNKYKDINSKPSFSVTIDDVNAGSGISDNQRAVTINSFAHIAKIAQNDGYSMSKELPQRFNIPGHVQLLIGSRALLRDRQGHTELSLALAMLAGVGHSATIVEMLSDNGNALDKKSASEYGKTKNFVFIEGKEIIKYWDSKFSNVAQF